MTASLNRVQIIGKDRYSTGIHVDEMKMLGSRQVSDASSPVPAKGNQGGGGGNNQSHQDAPPATKTRIPELSEFEENMPFVRLDRINRADKRVRRHA